MKNNQIFMIGLATIALVSCNHKDLGYAYDDAGNVRVVFDWRNAPDAAPGSMEAYFYGSAGATDPVRFIFEGRDGGTIHIADGTYSVMGMNSDNTDWARLRDVDAIETFEILTEDAESLDGLGLAVGSLPRARAAEKERMVRTPQSLYSDRRDAVGLEETVAEQTVTLYPEEVTPHYRVTVRDVENIRNLDGATLDATLSGMAEGYFHGRRCPAGTPVTMPFTLTADYDTNSLEGRFLTFGECPQSNLPHFLVVYMVFTDGTRRYQTFDVTDQVSDAKDPMNVHITVSGLDIQKRVDSGGGFRPEVDEWQSTDVDLKM